jgi:hypothetical protein
MYRKSQYQSANFFSNSNKPIEYYEYTGPKEIDSKENYSEYILEKKNDSIHHHQEIKKIGTTDPKIWGPQLWFILHNGASKYPISACTIYKQKMKDFIIGLPVILPCEKCKNHAIEYIEEHKDKLDDVCSGKEKLFKFFVDFHNTVNKRYNKSEMNYTDVRKLYF